MYVTSQKVFFSFMGKNDILKKYKQSIEKILDDY